MKKIAVIGAGSWGSALAILLASKGFDVHMWMRNKSQRREIREKRTNLRYLKEASFPQNIIVEDEVSKALKEARIVLFGVPSQNFRRVLRDVVAFIEKDAIIVNSAKGIEETTLKTLSKVASEEAREFKYAVISGPSHAEEVAKLLPTTVAVSSADEEVANIVQEVFFTDRFRVYTNLDLVGVEIGGAIKNVIALVSGMSDGLGFGDNAKAAIMTRGLAEMVRLGVALGASKETFLGLSGVGDLIATCTSMHSRNRRCGILIGEGMNADEAQKEIKMVVESISTTKAISKLAKKIDVEMPIAEVTKDILEGKIKAIEGAEILLKREKKNEKI